MTLAFLRKKKVALIRPSEVVDSSDSVSPKQSPEKCLFSQADGVVESKQFECLQNNIITMFTIFVTIVIKLLLLLDGFLSGISVAVSKVLQVFKINVHVFFLMLVHQKVILQLGITFQYVFMTSQMGRILKFSKCP